MARPIKMRDAESFSRDVAGMNRMRASLLLDRKLDKAKVKEAIGHIDALIDVLSDLTDLMCIESSDLPTANGSVPHRKKSA